MRSSPPWRRLAHAHRLEILELAVQGERSVALSERSGLSVANVSQHLQHRAGLVTARRQAKFALYSLGGSGMATGRGYPSRGDKWENGYGRSVVPARRRIVSKGEAQHFAAT
jgi:DNA-binding transcriptional ArsR family regulator